MTILISAVLELDPQHAERIIREAAPFIAAALAQPGCKAYSWTLDPSAPGRVCVFEEWDDQAILAAHFAAPHYSQMRKHLRSAGPIKSTSRKYLVAKSGAVYDADGKPMPPL